MSSPNCLSYTTFWSQPRVKTEGHQWQSWQNTFPLIWSQSFQNKVVKRKFMLTRTCFIHASGEKCSMIMACSHPPLTCLSRTMTNLQVEIHFALSFFIFHIKIFTKPYNLFNSLIRIFVYKSQLELKIVSYIDSS